MFKNIIKSFLLFGPCVKCILVTNLTLIMHSGAICIKKLKSKIVLSVSKFCGFILVSFLDLSMIH